MGRMEAEIRRSAKKWGYKRQTAYAVQPCSPSPRSVLHIHNGLLVTGKQQYEGLDTFVPILLTK
jgi:hypothetical protein